MSSKLPLYMAKFESTNTEQVAFGNTPEEALEAMLKLWVEEYAPTHGGDPNYLHDYREEIEISKVETGKAYIKGSTDFFWAKNGHRGDEDRFDEIFEKYQTTPAVTP